MNFLDALISFATPSREHEAMGKFISINTCLAIVGSDIKTDQDIKIKVIKISLLVLLTFSASDVLIVLGTWERFNFSLSVTGSQAGCFRSCSLRRCWTAITRIYVEEQKHVLPLNIWREMNEGGFGFLFRLVITLVQPHSPTFTESSYALAFGIKGKSWRISQVTSNLFHVFVHAWNMLHMCTYALDIIITPHFSNFRRRRWFTKRHFSRLSLTMRKIILEFVIFRFLNLFSKLYGLGSCEITKQDFDEEKISDDLFKANSFVYLHH